MSVSNDLVLTPPPASKPTKRHSTLGQEKMRLKFYQKLVLNQWILSLFNVDCFDKLAEDLKRPEYELLDENNVSRFHIEITNQLFDLDELPKDVLLGYDMNIVRHTQSISEARHQPIHWKYFQYLTLLFTEIYLDRYFRNSDKLLSDLNAYVVEFNSNVGKDDAITPFEMSDLKKLAFWSATGSGKTLLMHINILQYQHYLALYQREKELNRIILLTPNEGLSKQHLDEFRQSKIEADIFNKDTGSLFSGKAVEIIDIHKLRETMGDKTVAIEAFEGNNLVMVDEGHRGTGGTDWMDKRNRLCENGFSFEYSATFGQAIKTSGNKKLEQEYAKCILFDYSYKYFYRDGFGKDYQILNLADDRDEEVRKLYLTACLLAFYQQQKLFDKNKQAFKAFLLEKPLWIFVGGSVNAVRTAGGRKVSDVSDVLLFLANFIGKKNESIRRLERLLSGSPGLPDESGREIFANAFSFLITEGYNAKTIFDDMLEVLFNAKTDALIHMENLKGTDGEIALRLGEYEPFGVINVGDASSLCKLCEDYDELVVDDREFSDSLFSSVNAPDSTVNLLIGSKKFSEGWNSWRVSTMGLMNIGRSEGSEIIQLFGRGVRLKGYEMSLKRSRFVENVSPPKNMEILETLNVFGIRADYMRQFKEYLEEEGLPTNDHRISFVLPTVSNLGTKKLKTLKLQDGLDFKRQAPKPVLELIEHLKHNPVVLNWYPKIQAEQSKGVRRGSDMTLPNEGKFEHQHIAFLDFDAIYFEIQKFKNERSWYNLNLPREVIPDLLANREWYKLYIPKEELDFTNFDRVRRWQEIAIALLRKYCEKYYLYRKQEWELPHLKYEDLREDDPNFIREYQILIQESEEDILAKLSELKDQINAGDFRPFSFRTIETVWFGQHLYQPLLHLGQKVVEISPVSLNDGEKDFVLDLKTFHDKNKTFFSDKELYVLRNQSKGKGIGFFEAGNFHPDFIVWLLHNGKQYVSFVDPKGIRNLEGPGDPKIEFYQKIKTLEIKPNNPDVILNSFIISCTPFQSVGWWFGYDKTAFEKKNVLFQYDDKPTYIRMMMDKVLG